MWLIMNTKVIISTKVGIFMAAKIQALVDFGNKVRAARKESNLSQEELAAKVDLHRTYIGMIERGEKNITLLNILKISHALNISASELLEWIN